MTSSKPRSFCLGKLLLIFWCALCSSAAADRPNVIVILADDLGFECLTSNGGESYRTPNLDRLAATGLRFENCHVQPLCTPTRVQLMTGQYNIRNYVAFGVMDPNCRTFANSFHDAGYATAMVGKWQLGLEPSLPTRWGFDEHCLWQFLRLAERHRNPGLEINGKEMDYNNNEYGPELVCNYALDFITRNRNKPFLLYYPMILPHEPFLPTPDSPDYGKVDRKGKDPKYFADMVTYMDKLVGRVTAKLDELKIRERTLIIFLGDNGTHSTVTTRFRGQDYQGGKGQRTARGTHVPLIANWPGRIPTGRVNTDLVDSTDIFPTICEAAGLAVPKTARDGRSFWPQLQGQPGSPRDWSYCWYGRTGIEVNFEFAQDLNFKLYRDGGFIDLRKDPEEQSPLKTETLTAEAAAARSKLAQVLAQFKDARPSRLSAGSTNALQDQLTPSKGKKKKKKA